MERTILVVDDEEKITRIIGMILTHKGYKVLVANHANEALEKVKDNSVDLILSDIMMPDINGYELAEILKKDPKTSDIPLLFLSAKADISDKFTGYFVGAAEYITKPFDAEELLNRINRVFEVDALEKTYNLDSIETSGRDIAPAAAAQAVKSKAKAHSSASSAGTDAALAIFNQALQAVHSSALELYEGKIVEDAFSRALARTVEKHPNLKSLEINSTGLGATDVSGVEFDEANEGMCDLIRTFLAELNIDDKEEKPVRGGIKMLVFDTDEVNGDFYEMLLENSGFAVERAMTVDTAKEYISGSARPNLILLDTCVPKEFSGSDVPEDFLELYNEKRSGDSDFNVPILLIADIDNKDDVMRSVKDAGACLVKPFTGTELITAVVALLRK